MRLLRAQPSPMQIWFSWSLQKEVSYISQEGDGHFLMALPFIPHEQPCTWTIRLINGAQSVGVLPFVRIGLCTLRHPSENQRLDGFGVGEFLTSTIWGMLVVHVFGGLIWHCLRMLPLKPWKISWPQKNNQLPNIYTPKRFHIWNSFCAETATDDSGVDSPQAARLWGVRYKNL